MHARIEQLEYLEMLDPILVEHRAFGDSTYIHEQLRNCYERRLGKLSACMSVTGQLLDALIGSDIYTRRRVVGDTVVRCAIDHALAQGNTGVRRGLPFAECEEVFGATVQHLNDGKCGGPLEHGIEHVYRLGPAAYHGWIWSEQHCADACGRAFRRLIRDNHKEPLHTPNVDDVQMLEKGAQLLSELLPCLSRSALSHAHLIALFPQVGKWKGTTSSSQFRIGGTIFLSCEMIDSPWWVAEHLLHESLHQKLYDVRHGHSVFVEELQLSGETAKRVCSPWNAPGPNKANYWDTFRSVAAFHVYVQLGLLCSVAERRAHELKGTYGPIRAMTTSRTAMDRAHYLGEQIKQHCWQELGVAGRSLMEWLLAVLDILDPAPPPRGAYMHLLLDRYQREAAMVAKKIERAVGTDQSGVTRPVGLSSALREQLIALIDEEVNGTCSVLSAVKAGSDIWQFKDAVTRCMGKGADIGFRDVRGLIARTIQKVSPDGYRLTSRSPGLQTPDEIFKQMVENSSQRVHGILAQ